MEDEKIIALYVSGNEEAIRETQTKYGKYCHAIAYNILRNEEDAEECVSDTFLKLWEAVPAVKPNSLKAYLGTVCRHLSLNRLESRSAEKRGGNETNVLLDELSECIPSEKDVEAEVDGRLLKEAINAFLGTIPEKQRIVFMQRYWYCLSVKEISERNGFREENVKTLLFRARNSLKNYLLREGFEV